ncbi:modifier of mdg4-like isoform X3 [Coccinella septempunctata]|uniref:modifier of mdg4-like isoform X3 n=1 Tax=Coccinella septempunctata TaxID=41139 RepID=UPI001D07BB5B|nr:modifier of mdg4-like isoform X3 [Coccinella septempunctata]
MASEQFSLCWDNFHKNMSSGMNSLLENEDLVDVTLAVEGKYLKAHKMVLSVCSPYFKELFKTNPCKHPIVFMKDVSYVALSDLLQFMYQGEVQVSQENLTTFIKTAEALQIKGLTGDGSNATENDVDQEEKSVQHLLEDSKSEYKQSAPVPRPKKIAPQAVAPPPAKRQRSSTSSSEMAPSSIVTKTEPVTNAPTEFVQFKMEPYDQSQTISIQDDDEQFGEGLEENVGDETEDYSMMEGNEEEPQAGTSTEGTGEGQDTIFVVPGKKNPKIIVHEDEYEMNLKYGGKTAWRCTQYYKNTIFVAPGRKRPKLIVKDDEYEWNRRKNTRTYWRCSQYYKKGCSSKLITYGRTVKFSCGHNHAPMKPKHKKTYLLRVTFDENKKE